LGDTHVAERALKSLCRTGAGEARAKMRRSTNGSRWTEVDHPAICFSI
jgi:hypothetical protein